MSKIRKINVSEIEGNQTSVFPAGTIWVDLQNKLRVSDGVTAGGQSLSTSYSDSNVAAYLASNPPAGTYTDSNVAAYLPTYGGSVSATEVSSPAGIGNVVINTDDGTNISSWTFGQDGNLTLPSNLTILSTSNFAPITGTALIQQPSEWLIITTSGLGATAQLGWAENLFAGGNVAAVSFNDNDTGQLKITTGDYSNTIYNWTFGTDGSMAFPNKIILSPANQDITLQSDQYTQLMWAHVTDLSTADMYGNTNTDFYVESGGATLDIGYKDVGNNQQYTSWHWSRDGILTLPDTTTVAEGFINGGSGNHTAGISTYSGWNQVYAQDVNIGIQTSADGNTYNTWTFGTDGNTQFPGALTVAGNLTILGTSTTVGTQDLTVQDSIINLHTQPNLAAWTIDDGRDIGVKFHYYKTSDKHAFLGWANDTGHLEYYSDATETNGVITGTYGTVKAAGYISTVATGTAPLTVTSTTRVANLNVANAAYADTAGTATSATSATTAGTVTTAAQPNITSVGSLTGLTVTGTTNLGAVGNITITGGTNGYVLSTNGSGVLSWVAQSGGGASTGNITFSTATISTLGTNENITLDPNGTGNVAVVGGMTVTGNITTPIITSNIATGTAPLIVTSTTRVANLNVANAGYADTAGSATTATSATTAGTVTTAAQPNITSLGNLSVANITTINSGLLQNGTSNIVINNNGNINLSVGGTANVVTVTTSNLNVTGNVVASADLWTNTGNVRSTSGTGNIFNFTATTINMGGAATTINIGNASGITTISGNLQASTNGFTIGYLDIPQVAFAANANVISSSAGKHYYTTTANLALTIQTNANVAGFNVGAAVNFINGSTGNLTITPAAGVNLYLAGNSTSTSRTISSFGMASIQKVATDTWFIVGAGVS